MAIDAGSIYSSVRVKLDQLKGDVKSVETLLDQIGHSSQTNADKSEQAFTSSFNATKLAGVAAFARSGASGAGARRAGGVRLYRAGLAVRGDGARAVSDVAGLPRDAGGVRGGVA